MQPESKVYSDTGNIEPGVGDATRPLRVIVDAPPGPQGAAPKTVDVCSRSP